MIELENIHGFQDYKNSRHIFIFKCSKKREYASGMDYDFFVFQQKWRYQQIFILVLSFYDPTGIYKAVNDVINIKIHFH